MSWLGQALFYEQWTRHCPADDRSLCLPRPGCSSSAYDCNWQLTEAGATVLLLVLLLITLAASLSWLLHVQHQWTQFLDRYGRFFPQAQRKQDVLFLYWYCSEARLDMLEAGTVTPAEILRVAKEVGRLSELPTGDDGPFLSWLINDRERIERLVTHLKPAALEKLTSQKEVMFAMKQLEDAVWRRESLLETEAHTPTNPG